MELREWLIILGLALVTLIVVDGVRRLQRQRRIPRLDEVESDGGGEIPDPEAIAREAEINWELPNGGARVVRPADFSSVQPKPKLERQEHPGASSVLAAFRANNESTLRASSSGTAPGSGKEAAMPEPTRREPASASPAPSPVSASSPSPERTEPSPLADARETVTPAQAGDERREPSLSALDDGAREAPAAMQGASAPEPLAADPQDHDDAQDDERYRLVDFDGMGDSLKSRSRRVGTSMHRLGASLQKSLADRREQKRLDKARRDEERTEKAARDAERRQLADADRALREDEARRQGTRELGTPGSDIGVVDSASEMHDHADPGREDRVREDRAREDTVRTHPVLEKALRHTVSAKHARHALSHAEEIIVISVMCREEEGFSGTALLDLMLLCGLRYSRDMGIFHRFETEDPESQLQFSMVNSLKPGTFPIEAMDDFRTPGITLLMPLPGARDTAAAFEAMVETAMVIVRHLGGELKDENLSVMTAQTVEFARQRVQEFERRNRLNRYQAN